MRHERISVISTFNAVSAHFDFSFREGKAIFGPPIKLIFLKLYAAVIKTSSLRMTFPQRPALRQPRPKITHRRRHRAAASALWFEAGPTSGLER